MHRIAMWTVTSTVCGVVVAFAPGASAVKPPPAPTVPLVQFGSANYSRVEAGGFASITIIRDKNLLTASSVALSLSPGTATEGTDYVDPAGLGTNVVTIPGGSTSITFDVAISDDLMDEPNETVNLTLVNAVSNAQLGKRKTAKLTINDDDPSSTIAIDSPTGVAEGGLVIFTISVSGASSQLTGVTATTVPGTATSPGDYVHKTQNFSWPVGDATTRSFAVTTNALDGDEVTETFTVLLSNLINASGGGSGIGTILDTDPAPTFSVADASMTEGTGGTSLLSFTVSASGPMAANANVGWITAANLTATAYGLLAVENTCTNAGTDYVTATGTLSFLASASTPAAQTIDVVVCGDNAPEIDDTLSLFLLGSTYGTATDTGTGTITDDDLPVATVANNISSATEGDDLTFDVALSGPQSDPVTVDATVWSGSGGIWNPLTTPQTLTFLAGDVLESVTIDMLDDTVAAPIADLWIELVNPVGATLTVFNAGTYPTFDSNASLLDAWGLATIADDDVKEAEPNDSFGTANALTLPVDVVNGDWSSGGDVDFFAVTAPGAGTITAYSVDVPGGTCSNYTSDPFLILYDTDGTSLLIANDDSGPGFCSILSYAVPAAGTYYLRVGQAITFNTAWGTHVSFTP